MATRLTRQPDYDVRARRISGTHAEKLEQIDVAIQELLDIKALECASDEPNVRFLAVPRPRSHAFAMTVTILLLLIALVLLLGVRPARAQDLAQPAATPTAPGWTAPPQAPAPQLTREQILQRIAGLEAQIAELKAAVEQLTPQTTAPAVAQPVPSASADSVLADSLRDLKFGASLDTYYGFNFNRPVGRVNLLRAYDVLSNSFTLSQIGVVFESAPDPDKGRRLGARVDLQYGEATAATQGNPANEPRPWAYRDIFQAYGTYVAPIGSGLTIDFGKWASALGYEGNYAKDQINYSRSYWFDFLPFYHMGGRMHYQFDDKVGLNYWITNGTQQTEDFNNFKDQFAGLVVQPTKSLTWNVNYYLGQEHPDVLTESEPTVPTLPTQPGLSITPVVPSFNGKLQIFDTYASWQPASSTTVAGEADYVTSQNLNAASSRVSGGAAYFQHLLTARTALGVRGELLFDHGGLFSGQTQRLAETTVTYDYRFNDGFLVRTEWRRDSSNEPFFLTNTIGVRKAQQNTATLGLIWWWGTKRGAW